MISAQWSIVCAACGGDEGLTPERLDERAAIKDARVRGWQLFPAGFPHVGGAKGWICPDCNPDAPPRHKMTVTDALARQRRVLE